MYWMKDRQSRRYFVLPPQNKFRKRKSYAYVYGGIFVINDFQDFERTLYSFCNCSIAYTGVVLQEDLFEPLFYPIEPIVFKSIYEIETGTYTVLNEVKGIVMFANQNAKRVEHAMSHVRHQHPIGIDVASFLTMIKDER